MPTIIAYLLNAAEPGTSIATRALRFGRSASAPLPPDQHRAFEKTFGIPVIEAMGMTESASVVFCNPMDVGAAQVRNARDCRAASRRAWSTARARCSATADRRADAARTERDARILQAARSRRREAITADGWLHTGDLGHRDHDGFYFVTGRIKELIIKGGENIAPREIDEALLRHPAVLEAAAVGVPDRNYGQEILRMRRAQGGCANRRGRASRALRARARKLQDAAGVPVRRRAAQRPDGKVQRLKLAEAYRI